MSNVQNSVLISGASVAGLTTAYWLAKHGFDVTVVERAPHLRPGGQALDIRGPGLDVVERTGIIATLRDRSTKQAGMTVVDSSGAELFRSTDRTYTGGEFTSPDIEILRDELCNVLLEVGDPATEFLFDDMIVSLTQDADGVDVVFDKAHPRRFGLVIGADGLHSGVRKIVFGEESQFSEYLGVYIAVFPIPNFLELDRWQVLYRNGDIFCGVLGLQKELDARTYIAFEAKEPLEYDYRDVDAQKKLIVERIGDAGWEIPKIMDYMWDAPNFHFDPLCQIRMDRWSQGRVVLVGDAAYSVSPITGQGTTVALVGAYTLAGELAAHRDDPVAGIASYEAELRDYIARNQNVAQDTSERRRSNSAEAADTGEVPADKMIDFGALTQQLTLKSY